MKISLRKKSKRYYIDYRWKTSEKALWTRFKVFKKEESRDKYYTRLIANNDETWFEYKVS